MKCTTPEISWHNRDPVLSVDIQPITNDKYKRLASGGTDSHVLIWYIIEKETAEGGLHLELATDLTRHHRAVNVVRWSPCGEFLASGDDESAIFIWKKKNENETINILDTTNEQDKEIWLTYKILRGHLEDVYDLSWSPNSQQLISGSVDNKAILWDIKKGRNIGILSDHKGFVQGVSWDPKNKYVITLSTDRHFRIFDIKTKRVLVRNTKCIIPAPENSRFHGKTTRLIHDDTLQTFYRRLSFSPDGQLMVVPSGLIEVDGITNNGVMNATYIYTRHCKKQPVIVLPSPDQYSVAVRFCPLLFNLREYDEKLNPPMVLLPYRMIFAVATTSSVHLYDTQQKVPIGIISNIHYTRLTDLTWSMDGRILIVSSTDGFCTLILFDENELGTVYSPNVINNVPVKLLADDERQKQTINIENAVSENVQQHTNEENKNITDISTNISDQTKNTLVPSGEENEKILVSSTIATTSSSTTTTTTTGIAIEIPETIISSTEKFESPAKKFCPATPIQIRREPRSASKTPITTLFNVPVEPSPSPMDVDNEIVKSNSLTPTQTMTSSSTTTTPTCTPAIAIASPKLLKSDQKINRIAVRRQPRTIFMESHRDKIINTDEALDAWPIDEPKPISMATSINNKSPDNKVVNEKDEPFSPEFSVDFVLKYEETQNESMADNDELKTKETNVVLSPKNSDSTLIPVIPAPASKNTGDLIESNANPQPIESVTNSGTVGTPKTPRRVEFRTISTPKSKKKLL